MSGRTALGGAEGSEGVDVLVVFGVRFLEIAGRTAAASVDGAVVVV